MNNIIEFLNICDDDIEEYKTEIRDDTRIIQSNKLITRFAPINPGDPVTNIFFYSALLWSYSYSYLFFICPLWLFFYSGSSLFFSSFYPFHPVSYPLIISSLLNLLVKANLSERGFEEAMINSTYNVGWEEW